MGKHHDTCLCVPASWDEDLKARLCVDLHEPARGYNWLTSEYESFKKIMGRVARRHDIKDADVVPEFIAEVVEKIERFRDNMDLFYRAPSLIRTLHTLAQDTLRTMEEKGAFHAGMPLGSEVRKEKIAKNARKEYVAHYGKEPTPEQLVTFNNGMKTRSRANARKQGVIIDIEHVTLSAGTIQDIDDCHTIKGKSAEDAFFEAANAYKLYGKLAAAFTPGTTTHQVLTYIMDKAAAGEPTPPVHSIAKKLALDPHDVADAWIDIQYETSMILMNAVQPRD